MYWNFPKIEGGQSHGLGDSGMDLFKGDPVKSLAREICQNSVDVRVDDSKPVQVDFQVFDLPVKDFPGGED